MNSTLVSSGQSLLDICLQELGDVSAVFDLADANGLAITDDLEAGQQLVVPASLLARPEVQAYFAARKQRINTANYTTPPDAPALVGLIDWLESDFSDDDWY